MSMLALLIAGCLGLQSADAPRAETLTPATLAQMTTRIAASGLRLGRPGEPYDPAGFAMVRLAVPFERPEGLDAEASWTGVLNTGANDFSGEHYFYPASSIKLFAAIAAVEKLNALERAHADGLSLDSPLTLGPVRAGDEAAPTTTLRHEIHKLFVVSDNDAFNRLCDFLGRDGLNGALQRWGLERSWITHRLAGSFSAAENATAPGFTLAGQRGTVSEARREALPWPVPQDPALLPKTGLLCGDAVMRGGEAVPGPIDFSDRNRTTLAELQEVLMRLIRPDAVPGGGFDLTDDQRAFLLASAAMLPRESADPVYDGAKHPDDFVKFLLPGLLRVAPLADWRVTGKIGLAYGYVTENSFVEHLPSGRGVFVAAVIHRNPDGVFNDDKYDYDSTLKELADLGEIVGRGLAGGE